MSVEERIARIAADTGRPFGEGGAYASDMFADWPACVAYLIGIGLTDEQATWFLRSKHMRWCSDGSPRPYGQATAEDLAAYVAKLEPGSIEAMGEGGRPFPPEAPPSPDARIAIDHVYAAREAISGANESRLRNLSERERRAIAEAVEAIERAALVLRGAAVSPHDPTEAREGLLATIRGDTGWDDADIVRLWARGDGGPRARGRQPAARHHRQG